MMPQYFHILHVFSVVVLFGVCAAAAAAPLPGNRKKFLMWSGIASLIVFISGFGLSGILKIGFPVWIWMKIFCWLGLSVLVGVYFRTPENARTLTRIALVLVFFAVSMVYLKP